MDRREIAIRPIVAADAITVADLHATSWRDGYRGMLRDEYLDGDIAAERRQVWTARLGESVDANYGFIAEAETGPVGFAYMLGGVDATWGTLIDNLHVLPRQKGRGIGRRLLEELLRLAEAHGFHSVIARITGANDASIALHAACGFETVGTEREVGRKFGQWLDVVEMQRML